MLSEKNKTVTCGFKDVFFLFCVLETNNTVPPQCSTFGERHDGTVCKPLWCNGRGLCWHCWHTLTSNTVQCPVGSMSSCSGMFTWHRGHSESKRERSLIGRLSLVISDFRLKMQKQNKQNFTVLDETFSGLMFRFTAT